jgi:hypothetical protein
MRYMVELRSYSEDGDDYSEDHYAFETREECIKFASKNRSEVHSVHDYQDRDHDPINITRY